MSSRPTPETNEAKREGLMRGNAVPTQVVHVSVAERLEQQRDAAISRFESSQHARMGLKRERDELQRAAQNHRGAANIAIEALDRAITQRDEARELARELRDALLAREELNQVGLLFADENLLRRVDETHRKAIAKAKEVLP
jgi:Holliday junction resolvasome RuvABC ATP-dependent DNA helicase subunit